MDDPARPWPFWKFGLKQSDLSGSLHDQYNTLPCAIQDADAFHHDVWDSSTRAATADEFHRLLARRRDQRLAELEAGLFSVSCEIVADPGLLQVGGGAGQWQCALQLFRARSLDALVRYFSTYVPDECCCPESGCHTVQHPGSVASSFGTAAEFDFAKSPPSAHVNQHPAPVARESLGISTSIPAVKRESLDTTISASIPAGHTPPSSVSTTLRSNSSAPSPLASIHEDSDPSTSSSARTESPSDSMLRSAELSHHSFEEHRYYYDTTQPDDGLYTPATSASDICESQDRGFDSDFAFDDEHMHAAPEACANSIEVDDTLTSNYEVPSKSSCRSSPTPSWSPLRPSSPRCSRGLREYLHSPRRSGGGSSSRNGSPAPTAMRRSTGTGRVQKPQSGQVNMKRKLRFKFD